MTIRHAMVLAAGLGSRMRPITDHTPKPLVKIAGKPLLDYALDALKAAGCEQVVVNVHHLADQVEAHLASRQDLEILISDERDGLLNSGGGLAKGLSLLPDTAVYVMNADLFWVGEPAGAPTNLERLAGFFDAERMDMALLCVPLDRTTGHEGGNDFSLDADGQLTRYKPDQGEGVVYAGAIVMNKRLLDDAPKGAFNLNLYFDRAIAANRLYGLILEGQWITAGTVAAIQAAEDAVRRHGKQE